MRRHRRPVPSRLLAAALPIVAALSGCTVVVDGRVGDLESDRNALRTVVLRFEAFVPHVNQLFDAEVVDNASNRVVARATLDPLPDQCAEITLERAIFNLNDLDEDGEPLPEEQLPFRVDFWADLLQNGQLDPPPSGGEAGDHSWSEGLVLGRLPEDAFVHEFSFDDITGANGAIDTADVVAQVEGAPGAFFEATLVLVQALGGGETRRSERAVYVGRVEEGTAAWTMEDIVDGGEAYELEVVFSESLDAGRNDRCTLELIAPAGGDLEISESFGDLACDTEPGRQPFFNCSRGD